MLLEGLMITFSYTINVKLGLINLDEKGKSSSELVEIFRFQFSRPFYRQLLSDYIMMQIYSPIIRSKISNLFYGHSKEDESFVL